MANNVFSYTNRDYERSRREGLARIPYLSNGVWTDLNPTDPGVIMLDYVHALVDMINFYQDHQALETFIPTARERENLFRLAKQFNYNIKSARAATVTVTFKSNYSYPDTIIIPKGTRVKASSNNVEFVTVKDKYLLARESSVNVLCKQGKIMTSKYRGTGLSRYSDVEPPLNRDQTVTLTDHNIELETISIKDQNGDTWNSVPHIVYTNTDEKAYQADLNPDDTITIKFGNGERGAVPQITDLLTISYLVTDTTKGNVSEKMIDTIIDGIYDVTGSSVELYVTNNEASIGGSLSQSSTSIRELAPAIIKSNDRAVTLNDYQALAKNVEGVYNAKAYDVNIDREIPYHQVRVLILPEENYFRSAELLSKVYDYLYQRMIPSTQLKVMYPDEVVVNISVTVKTVGTNNTERLQYNIEESIRDYFSIKKRGIGESFFPTDLSAVIASIPGVKYITDITPSNIVKVTNRTIAVLGTMKVSVS